MASLTFDAVDFYLERYGWSFHKEGDCLWYTGWQGEKHSFPLVIELNDSVLSLQVTPLIKLGVDWASWPELLRHILELNHDCQLVKIGINESGEIALSLHIMNIDVPYEEFADSLGVIGHYAELLREEILQYLNAIGYFIPTNHKDFLV